MEKQQLKTDKNEEISKDTSFQFNNYINKAEQRAKEL